MECELVVATIVANFPKEVCRAALAPLRLCACATVRDRLVHRKTVLALLQSNFLCSTGPNQQSVQRVQLPIRIVERLPRKLDLALREPTHTQSR